MPRETPVVGYRKGEETGLRAFGDWWAILINNLPELCSYPKKLSEAEFKSTGLINLIEERSRQTAIQAVVWLLPASLILVYREECTTGSKDAKGVWIGDEKGVSDFRSADKMG